MSLGQEAQGLKPQFSPCARFPIYPRAPSGSEGTVAVGPWICLGGTSQGDEAPTPLPGAVTTMTPSGTTSTGPTHMRFQGGPKGVGRCDLA